MRTRLRYVFLLAISAATAGCNVKHSGDVSNSPAPAESGTVAAVPEVPGELAGVVDRLKQVAANVKLDGDGFVSEVDFRGTILDDDGVLQLAGLDRLQSLLLNDTIITDASLIFVGRLNTLRNLDLRGCRVSNDGMAHLSGLTNLRALRLSGAGDWARWRP